MEENGWPLIPREHYMEKIMASKDAPFIKVITGIRRCGKTTLMQMFRRWLLESGVDASRILSINFDSEESWIPRDRTGLYQYVSENAVLGKGTYLFFDEIQNVEGWEAPVRTFYDKGCDIYITGSNSQMLSSEISTKLSGRDIEIRMAPLVFSEYAMFRKGSGRTMDQLFQDYILHGGLPAIAISEDTKASVLIPEMIAGVYNSVVIKDVMERHDIRNPASLRNLMRFVMRNIGDRTSSRKASNYMTSAGTKISHVTVDEYLDYLDEAYLAIRSRRIDSKTSEYMVTSDKFYAQDLGIRNHVAPFRPEDIDGLIENVVFNELVFRYGEVCVCNVGDLEVDFLADPKGKPQYFQVCTNISDPDTLERELRPFRVLEDSYPRTIIVYDRYPMDSVEGVRIVSLLDWLLE